MLGYKRLNMIERPKADCKLYRYRSASNDEKIRHIIDEIINCEVYLANPNDFNDPFETQYVKEDYGNEKCLYKKLSSAASIMAGDSSAYSIIVDRITKKYANIEYISIDEFVDISYHVVKKCNKSLTEKDYKNSITSMVRKQIKSAKIDDLHIASFSEDSNSIPMWAYYADSHKGVCLEYDLTSINEDNRSILEHLYKVFYSINVPKNENDMIYSPLLKGIQWAHENEWRYIYFNGDNNIIEKDGKKYLKMPFLSKIILGCNAEPRLQETILSAVIKKKNLGSVSVTMMNPSYDKYELYENLIFGFPSK